VAVAGVLGRAYACGTGEDLGTLGHDRGAPGKGESGNCGSGPAGGRCIHASTLVRAGFTVLGLTGCMRAENVF